jgi:hypothetical protein
MTVRKAYRVRLVPTAAQQEPFLRWAGTGHDVYTWAPAWREAYGHERSTSPPAWREAYGHERSTSPRHVAVWRRHNAHSERS